MKENCVSKQYEIFEKIKNEFCVMFYHRRLNRVRFISCILSSKIIISLLVTIALVLNVLAGKEYQSIIVGASIFLSLSLYTWFVVRRLNDIDMSGNLILFANGSLALIFIENMNRDDSINIMYFSGFYFSLITVLMILIAGCKDANTYGECPNINASFSKKMAVVIFVIFVIVHSLLR